jgi:ribonuclease P protein component
MLHRLTKAERLSSKAVIERLFSGGNGSMAMFPLRTVWMLSERSQDDTDVPLVRMLVSIPKKRLHHAVDRNRMKRQVREAFRLNKEILWKALEGTDKRVDIAFIGITDQLMSSRVVHRSVVKSLVRISEKL